MVHGGAVVVAGPPATGKSSLARALAANVPTAVVIDKDDLTGPLVAAALAAAGEPLDLDGPYYKRWLSPACYSVVEAVAAAVLAGGAVPIVVAPYEWALNEASWRRSLAQRIGAERLGAIWMDVAVDVMRGRLTKRGSPRDRSKLADWQRYAETVPVRRRPPWRHEYVDTTDETPDALVELASDLAARWAAWVIPA